MSSETNSSWPILWHNSVWRISHVHIIHNFAYCYTYAAYVVTQMSVLHAIWGHTSASLQEIQFQTTRNIFLRNKCNYIISLFIPLFRNSCICDFPYLVFSQNGYNPYLIFACVGHPIRWLLKMLPPYSISDSAVSKSADWLSDMFLDDPLRVDT